MDTKDSRLNQAVAGELRAARGKTTLSVDELAEKAHMSRSTVKRLLDGTTDVPVGDLAVLADVMGTDLGKVLKRALEDVGGLEPAVSDLERILTNKRDELATKRAQQQADKMSGEEIQDGGYALAAGTDPEGRADESGPA